MFPIKKFLGNIQGLLRWAGQRSTHYHGPMAGVCRFYRQKLPTMRSTMYCCLWWDNPTSIVRIMWALPMHIANHFPQYIQEIIRDFL